MLTLDHDDYDTAEKPQSRPKESFSPMLADRVNDADRRDRLQQTHTAKRRNERSQELYRTHFHLEHTAARSADRQGAACGTRRQRNPFIRDVFKSQVLIS